MGLYSATNVIHPQGVLAFAANARILVILNEPVSSIDFWAGQYWLNCFRTLFAGRTWFIITHRVTAPCTPTSSMSLRKDGWRGWETTQN
jgi:hypothetical protein